MAAISDCPGCRAGIHKRHRWDWGVKKGLLGGYVCECKGDCKERFEASYRAYKEMWDAAQPSEKEER